MVDQDTENRAIKPFSRRTVLKAAGVATLSALLAGCSQDNGGGNGDGGNDEGGGANSDPSEWEGVSEIELGGQTSAWQGQSPPQIEGEENPTLVLFEGEQYTVTWENLDGAEHNFELRNENDEVVDDHSTDLMGEQGETQTYEFEATSEMAQYVCNPHENTMRGDIQLESSGGSGGNESDGQGNESS